MPNHQHQIILASGSRARAILLEKAGVKFTILPADIDEDKIRDDYVTSPNQSMHGLARRLAGQKAAAISGLYTEKYIIGADQLLVLENHIFSKPGSIENASAQLQQLRGKMHHLISAVSIVKNGENLWTYSEQAEMHMRKFTDAFLERYLQDSGEGILSCVGGYQLEGKGAQLFDSVNGDYFTVLGLPLIPLLDFFRTREVLLS